MGRILLIEVDAASRAQHQRALEASGHTVCAAPGVNGALGALGRRVQGDLPVDLMIVEVGLMDAHGVDVLTRLRALPGASSLPVLGLAGAAAALRGELAEGPLDDVLLKPTPPERLVLAVGRLLEEGPTDHARLQRLMRVQAALLARLSALGRANEAIAGSASLDGVLQASLQGYVDTGAFDLAAALLQDGTGLRVAACVCPWAPTAAEALSKSEALLLERACGPAPSLLPDEGGQGLVDALGLVTLWVGPLMVNGARVGVAALGSSGRGLAGAGGFVAAALGQLSLATRLSRSVAALAASEARFRHIAEELPRGLVAVEEGRVVYLNARGRALLQPDDEEALGREIEAVLPGAPRAGAAELERAGRALRVEARRYEEGGAHILLLLDDVTGRRRRERALQEQAHTDALTGLCNRRYLDEEGAAILQEQAERGAPSALLFMDLDHFKQVNDTRGHAVGDALLRAVGEALSAGLRGGDLVARLGGDEFAVLLPGASLAVGAQRAEGLRRAVIDAGRALLGEASPVDVSVGVAESRSGDMGALLEAADRAMYRAKRGGRGRVVAGA